MDGEHIRPGLIVRPTGGVVLCHLRNQIWGNRIHVVVDGGPSLVAGYDEVCEVFVEQVADDLDQHVWLFVERDRRACGLFLGLSRLRIDLFPVGLQAGHIFADVLLFDTLGRGANDHAGVRWHHLTQDLLEPLPFGVGQLAADSGRGRTRHIHQVATRQ